MTSSCLRHEPAQPEWEPNYDESLVPDYTLPDPLRLADGRTVGDTVTWRAERRPEILALFEEHVYGRTPHADLATRVTIHSVDPTALGGSATRKIVTLHFGEAPDGLSMQILLYLPNDAERPAPAFLGLNFYGNHSIHPDPEIPLSDRWMRQTDDFGIVDNRATEASRGVRASRWPVERILARGYALATVYYGDIDPDFDDGFRNGVHPLLDPPAAERAEDAWGSIGAWAWGLRRALDHLVADPDVDGSRVAVVGHSRLGKAALWAGAQDPRFALVISNDSGAGGAALSRRAFGETVARINAGFPHWFARSFRRYDGNEAALPVDQHMLISLVAPRPAYVASATEDRWADPRGEYLSAFHAGPVYALHGLDGLPSEAWPPGTDLHEGAIGYHLRPGPHDITPYDWDRFMDFADRWLLDTP